MKKRQILLLCTLVSSLFSYGQFVTTNGPLQTASFTYLYAQNDTAFAAKGENLWRTTDGGTTWKILLNSGLPEKVDPRAITVARKTIFIGTNNNARVYSSNDWGNSWSAAADGGTALWVPTHLTSNGEEVLIGGTTFEPHYFDFTNKKWVSSGLSGTTHALRFQSDGSLIANVGSAPKVFPYFQ